MIETSSVPPQKSSATFGNLRKLFVKCSETFVKPLEQFWIIFGNLRKVVGNLRKVVKTLLLVCLYNKHNNTWTFGDMEFIFSCSHSISHSFASLARLILMWTLEDKFHISARPCIILYLILYLEVFRVKFYKEKFIYSYCVKVGEISFQHFPRRRFWWFIIITLYKLMLQPWYQKTAQTSVNTVVSLSWHNKLP